MSTLTVTKSYSNGNALTEAHLDSFAGSIETFFNSTGLTADNIQDEAITTATLATGAVTTAKIAANNVTAAKLEPLGEMLTNSSSSFSTTSTSFTSVTNLSTSFTATGRPIMILLVGTSTSWIRATLAGNPTIMNAAFFRDSTQINSFQMIRRANGVSSNDFGIPVGAFRFVDVPTAGTYTYSVKVKSASSDTVAANEAKLLVFEL